MILTPPHFPLSSFLILLVSAFLLLSHDDTPMVRRATATTLPHLVPHLAPELVASDVLQIFEQILYDDQDSVRLYAVDTLIALAERQRHDVAALGLLRDKAELLFLDHSWRVHYVLAEKFAHLAALLYRLSTVNGGQLGPSTSSSASSTSPSPSASPSDGAMDVDSSRSIETAGSLQEPDVSANMATAMAHFIRLMGDDESEVRMVACSVLPAVSGLFYPELIERQLLPVLEQPLVSDRSDFVRAALALQVSELSRFVSKEATLQRLLPILIALLKDAHAEVRLNVISKLETIHSVIGITLLSQSLLPAVIELANDTKWRVRLAIIQHLPLLAVQLGLEFFNSALKDLALAFLGDVVYTVRITALKSLSDIMKAFGRDWAVREIFPQLMAKADEVHYLYRLMTLFAIRQFCQYLDKDVLISLFIPVLSKLAADPVPNIRFNVAKTVQAMALLLDFQARKDRLMPILSSLAKDSDDDVIYFTKKAIAVTS